MSLARALCFGLFASSAALVIAACAMSGTDGRVAVIEMSLASVPEPGKELGRAEALGQSEWEVELHEAKVVVGAVYLFGPARTSSRWFRELFVGHALAHAGEDNLGGRTALAEVRQPIVVDALSDAPVGPHLTIAEIGRVEQASVYLDDPRGELAGPGGPTRGHVAWVSGVARRDGLQISFEGGLDIENTPLMRRIDAIPVRGPNGSAAYLEEGARIRVGIRAGRWLRNVDFDRHLQVADVRTPMRPSAPSQFHGAFQFGLQSPNAFSAEIEEVP